ncbi:YdcF family protein [Paramagnetospirillum magneticum]|uniref:YdcF family protein n=1 Tax=Paramagnetospirillum magneticum TaxID=84159 RepID=UPI0005C1B199|nr:YdcF family protein [Paramagnetospirillum magneticum]
MSAAPVDSPVAPFDAAIVLGAMVRPDGSPSPALVRRVEHGVRLAAGGHVRHLLMSGGPVRHATPEAHVMRDLAVASGIPPGRVHVETSSVNTIGNALMSRPLVEAKGWKRLLVVTDACHMPRTLYVFRRLGPAVVPSAAWPRTLPAREWYWAWLREAAALPWTIIRVERLKHMA